MAMIAMDLPLLSFDIAIPGSPRFRRSNKTPKSRATQTKPPKTQSKDEGGALQKVGAFGISVRKVQQASELKNDENDMISPIDENAEDNEAKYKNLPGVEISLTKKIKKRIVLKHTAKHTDALTSSDKEVLEDLRRGLRSRAPPTADHGGNRSVLEAISDPKIRESRMYYEPMATFLAGNGRKSSLKPTRKQAFSRNGFNSSNMQGFPQDLRLVNMMVPPSQKHFNTPVDPSPMGNTSRLMSRSSTKHGYPLYPKMSTSLFNMKPETREREKASTATDGDIKNQVQYSLTPSNEKKKEDPMTEFSLPSISLQIQQEGIGDVIVTSHISTNDHGQSPTKHNFNQTDQVRRATRNIRRKAGRYQYHTSRVGVKHTSKTTEKSRLIGPMNKMDMIVEYNKMLQTRVINYDQYISRLSKLSLHKIDLGNSGLRQYHIARDGTTDMKPRLAKVDIYPTESTAIANKENASPDREGFNTINYNRRKNADASADRHVYSTTQQMYVSVTDHSRQDFTPYNQYDYRTNQTRLSRVSIGEGIPESRFEHSTTGYDFIHDEFLTYDDVIRMQGKSMDRYQDAHRPLNSEKKSFHWTHIPPSSRGGPNKRLDPHGELYAGYSGKPLPNSREIKKRLNFSYPSYDLVIDSGNDLPLNEKLEGTGLKEQSKVTDPTADPDYLAISLEQPPVRSTTPERPAVTSSLSIHDVTLPTEMKVVTGRISQKGIVGNPKKGLALGSKDLSNKPNEVPGKQRKQSIESLNITPVAITSSPATNPHRSRTRSPYYVSQDEFSSTGTDGVLQNHLTTIYKTIDRAKTRGEPIDSDSKKHGKNVVPDVRVTTTVPITIEHNSPKPVKENATLLQPAQRQAPPNTPPPTESKNEHIESQAIMREKIEKVYEGENLKQIASAASATSSLLLTAPSLALPGGSPPTTAYLLKTREEETTSVDSDDAPQDLGDVISVNVTAVPVKGSA